MSRSVSPENPCARLAVIGTGLSGMVQALALARRGIAVTLVGPAPHNLQQDERTTAILMPCAAFLQELGLWDALAPTATRLETMELIDGAVQSVFHAAEIGEQQFGFNIANAALKQELVLQLEKNSNVRWHRMLATTLQQRDKDWEITLENGEKQHAEFLIGAEGGNSLTRQEAGIGQDKTLIDQSALVTILATEKPHGDRSVEWYFHGGPLTLVPMHGTREAPHRMAVVWCASHAQQEQRRLDGAEAIAAGLSERTGGRFGRLRVAGPVQLWPIRPMRATRLVTGSCALVGEAAHILPPIGAQGFNTSLFDIMALADTIQRITAENLEIRDNPLLYRYERNRLPEITRRYQAANMLNRLLLSPSSVIQGLRRVALGGATRLSFIKNHLMHTGMHQNSRPLSRLHRHG